MIEQVKKDLREMADKDKEPALARFFKTGKGEYGEGDKFLGVKVPDQRKIAKKHKGLDLKEVQQLLQSDFHEERVTALLILVLQFKKAGEAEQEQIVKFYLRNAKKVNNWDLVDLSAPKILGPWLLKRDRKVLYELVKSDDLWEKRIAMLACYAFIREADFDDALKIAEILVDDKHDLIQKAVGWMLREIGNRDLEVEEGFLKKYYKTMPRTMLRYAIEKFEKGKKDFYMGR